MVTSSPESLGWAGMKGSYIQPFGMIRWLNGALARQWREESLGYMGLGFD